MPVFLLQAIVGVNGRLEIAMFLGFTKIIPVLTEHEIASYCVRIAVILTALLLG